MFLKPGNWVFVNKENNATLVLAVADLQKGTVAAAFASANTTLAPSSPDSLVAYQARGKSGGSGSGSGGLRYTSVKMGKKMAG